MLCQYDWAQPRYIIYVVFLLTIQIWEVYLALFSEAPGTVGREEGSKAGQATRSGHSQIHFTSECCSDDLSPGSLNFSKINSGLSNFLSYFTFNWPKTSHTSRYRERGWFSNLSSACQISPVHKLADCRGDGDPVSFSSPRSCCNKSELSCPLTALIYHLLADMRYLSIPPLVFLGL